MSAPIQNPLLNSGPNKPSSVNANSHEKPEDASSRKDKDKFENALNSADQARLKEKQDQADAVAAKGKETVKGDETAVAGKDLPGSDLPGDEDDAAVLAGEDLAQKAQKFNNETLSLEFSVNKLSASQVDDAVLFAARFAVDGLATVGREGVQETTLPASQVTTQPELLAKLQKMVSQDGLSLKLDTGVIEPDPALALNDVIARATPVSTSGNEAKLDGINAQNAVNESRVAMAAVRTEMVVPNKVGSEGWGEAMAGRIQILMNQKISSARIHITPPDLGPIEVRVNVNHDQASVQFTSPSAQVRDALEQSIPRLREMLEGAGFSLADSGVSDQGAHSDGGSQSSGGTEATEFGEEQVVEVERRETLGLVDDYV